MKHISSVNVTVGIFFTLMISLILFSASGCTRYNPYTGMYEPDPGMTMMAVGSAALAGSVIYHESKHHNYHRPPYHYHYYRNPPRPPAPPGRPYHHR